MQELYSAMESEDIEELVRPISGGITSSCRAVGTGPADPAAAGPIIWQARIFMFNYINFRERELILVEFMPSDVRF